ncbi:MAG: ferritin, partial [Alphaproteobacteria bacterium]|nr:ferritin [Alphaproteobacteria bacterium]
QVEEEASAGLIIKKLKMIEGDGRGLLMIDQELGQRTFTPIATN